MILHARDIHEGLDGGRRYQMILHARDIHEALDGGKEILTDSTCQRHP